LVLSRWTHVRLLHTDILEGAQPDDALVNEGWPEDGYEILDEKLEMGVVTVDWIELDTPW
jgi:hypothetical protein